MRGCLFQAVNAPSRLSISGCRSLVVLQGGVQTPSSSTQSRNSHKAHEVHQGELLVPQRISAMHHKGCYTHGERRRNRRPPRFPSHYHQGRGHQLRRDGQCEGNLWPKPHKVVKPNALLAAPLVHQPIEFGPSMGHHHPRWNRTKQQQTQIRKEREHLVHATKMHGRSLPPRPGQVPPSICTL